ncbi:MAG: energy transducer TonB [Cognaticolwellia sp.]
MKKHYLLSIFPLLLTFDSIAEIALSKHLTTTTEPSPKVRVTPKYPKEAARQSREGWAKLSFIIEKDGSVSNVITKETSGSKDLTLAAKKAVMKWQYEPAMENGEPIQQCANDVLMMFRMDGNGASGATRRFQSLYKKTQTALSAKNYPKTKELLKRFDKIKYLHLSENNYLQLLSAQYASEIDEHALQLSHLNKIVLADTPENAKQLLSILDQKFIIEIKLNRLKSAYNTFKRIKKMSIAAPYLEGYQEILKRVDNFINSDNELIVNGDIRSNDYWYHALVRNEFTLSNISGELTKMDIRCANKRHIYSIENNNTWKIPATWQQCQIFIFGENNATFSLIEHPFKV